MRNFIQVGIEKYCPVCDANEIYTALEKKDSKNGQIRVECPKCGYNRAYTKEEVLEATA